MGGKIITKDGRGAVSSDPTGREFPWRPVPPQELLAAAKLINGKGEAVSMSDAVKGKKAVALYFSAHWCPPCRGFTPKLAEWHGGGLKDKMEIIFVSSDRDQASFDDYAKDMPWLALPYDKRTEKEALSEAIGVEGIPTFAVINPDGTIITTDGRSRVTSDPKGESFPEGWLPQPYNNVNDDPSPLNEEQCLIALGNVESPAAVAVRTVACDYYELAGKVVDAMPLRFFYGPDGGVTGQLRKLTGVVDNKLILLDIPDDGGFYVCDVEASSPEVINQFISDVQAKKVQRKQLQK